MFFFSDMLVQAKSGTGKTLVFSILAIENLNLQSNTLQKMIIAPTREIAAQIKDTIKKIAHFKTRIAFVFYSFVLFKENRVGGATTARFPFFTQRADPRGG